MSSSRATWNHLNGYLGSINPPGEASPPKPKVVGLQAMIKIHIVERDGANLFQVVKGACYDGTLRTFSAEKRGRKITHTTYPGYITWSSARDGVIIASVRSPRRPQDEWMIMSAFIGRLADKYPSSIHTISLQFDTAAATRQRRGAARRK
jgi:hypothetical protein